MLMLMFLLYCVCVIVLQVFYYQEVAYPPQTGRFKGHAVWSGDILRRDASISLHEVPPTFNGTFICQVRNRPDVHGRNGEIVLKVVSKGQTGSAAKKNKLLEVLECMFLLSKSIRRGQKN